VTTTEKASSQSHFIDLCRLLGEPTPHEADPTGEHYAFEKRVAKGGGGDGFADVWKRADLKAAYKQLLDYREDLENPPLLIVSDIERIEIGSHRHREHASGTSALATTPQSSDGSDYRARLQGRPWRRGGACAAIPELGAIVSIRSKANSRHATSVDEHSTSGRSR